MKVHLLFISYLFSAIILPSLSGERLGSKVSAQQCDIIYVTVNGAASGAAGTQANPADLTYGLTLVTATANQLWLATGTYTISTPLFIPSNVTIEGGFNAVTWAKSNGTPSIIYRDANNPAGPPANALFALVGTSVSGFRLQDLTINTANAPGNGTTVYGIYLDGCSNYNITRCEVSTGSGAPGFPSVNGTPGTPGGNGSPGNAGMAEPGPIPGGAGGIGTLYNGGNGANTTGYDNQSAGAAGAGACGGAGGAGGTGPSCSAGCFFGPPSCGSTTPGQPGQPGGNGTVGTTGTVGTPGSIAGCYFVPGGAGGNGGNGTDGCGGGGGGAGGGRQENGADDWGGSGGGGGGGGSGGTGGTGGTGGGGSFAVFLCNNGAGGIIQDCFLNPGAGGTGGFGTGGAGGAGGIGGAGGAAGVCSNGVGGNGGNGGNGGAGGDGGPGATGLSIVLSENGGTPVTNLGVTSVPGNPPVITVMNHGCTNSEVVFTAASSATWNFGAGASPATGNGAGPISVYYSSLGRKTISFSGTNFTDFINIFQNGPALPSISTASTTIASGCPTLFSTSLTGTYYQWYFPSSANPDSVVGASATSANNIIFFSTGTYTIYLYVTTACCGRVKDSLTVTVLPSALNISLNPSPASVCAGSSLTFTATPPGYTGYNFFLNGVSVQNGAGNTFTSSTLLNGDSIMVMVTNGTCFNGTNAMVVTVNPVPVANISAQANVLCFGGNNGSATASVTVGGSPFTYLWSNSQSGATASNLTAGNYSVLITDANGCTTSQSVSITQPAASLSSSVTSTNITCNGMNDGTAFVNANGGTGSYTYNWSPSGGSAASATGLIAGNYTATVTDANGCTNTNTFTITQPAVLTASVTSTNVTCFGFNNGTSTVTAAGGTGAYTYAWFPSGGNSSAASNLSPGNYTITVTDVNGCTNTNSITITQPGAALTASVTSTNISCNGANDGTASVNANGGTVGYTYNWSPSGGTSSSASGLTAGNYTTTVTDANGCTNTNTFTIIEPPAITVITFQNNVTCNGLSNGQSFAVVNGGTPGYSYLWSNGQTTQTATGFSAGNYSLTVTDASGCTTTFALTITQPLVISPNTSQSIATCGNNDGTATSNTSGGTPAYTYSWNNGQTTQTASGLTPYTIYTVTITDSYGCTASDTVSVGQAGPPVANITGNTIICNGNNTALTASGGLTYVWNTFATTTSITVSPNASTNYSVVATNGACSDTAFISVTVNPTPTASAGTDTTIMQFESTTLNGNGGTSYQWFPPTDLSCLNCQNPSASPNATTTYIVIVTDANGCTAIDSVTIFVTPIECNDPYLPNAFSPNGDGENDVLKIYSKVPECIVDVKLVIYNRWGEKVFQTEDPTFEWDGTYNRAILNNHLAGTEVFVYKLEVTVFPDKQFKKTGNISLVQ
ncbi:MAG: gliding motility-associated C-terminal domain-containing protein [Bacteroidetes bacterium]|nr:gliding motility-associated C-terminal domain-containing protein [Bacteroidota bacterium]